MIILKRMFMNWGVYCISLTQDISELCDHSNKDSYSTDGGGIC